MSELLSRRDVIEVELVMVLKRVRVKNRAGQQLERA